MTNNFFFFVVLFFISLLFSTFLGNSLIKILKSLNAKQVIREDGPKEHIVRKSETPTIGGLIFLIPVLCISLSICFLKKNYQTLDLVVVLSTTFIMATLGFIDDYLKVIKKHNKGISGWSKLFVQLLVSLAIFYLYKEKSGIIYLVWVFFVISGASNSFNLTDGLDGLLTSICLVSFVGFSFLLYQENKIELVTFSLIILGSLAGFLYFNKYPAKIFMGDTGSLALGGAIGSLAIISRAELYLICFATIPILEALSVILQVASFQFSKRFLGKDIRIFKMAPLHHHFELCGWKETDIVRRFFVFQIICMLIGVGIASLHHF